MSKSLNTSVVLLALLVCMCSSTYYSLLPNYTITYERSHDELGYANYVLNSYEKGWNFLQVYPSSRLPLTEQHRAAGFLEGYITYRDIYSAYNNLQNSMLGGDLISLKVQAFVDEQLEFVENMVLNHPLDIFWQHIGGTNSLIKLIWNSWNSCTEVSLPESISKSLKSCISVSVNFTTSPMPMTSELSFLKEKLKQVILAMDTWNYSMVISMSLIAVMECINQCWGYSKHIISQQEIQMWDHNGSLSVQDLVT